MAENQNSESDAVDQLEYRHDTKACLTSIFGQLRTITPEHEEDNYNETSRLSNLKGDVAKNAKAIFLTLHFLFPHELLPALDLLDRSLVNKHRQNTSGLVVYYVQSASSLTDTASRAKSRFRNAFNPTKTFYEVRLDSWNCSCAAFAQSSLKTILSRKSRSDETSAIKWPSAASSLSDVIIGGSLTQQDSAVAMCKHILAVAIAESCPAMFSNGVNCVDVTWTEVAGWASGFGEI